MKLDILAIGAHPDDVELSCAGTLLKEASKGKKIGILDLTAGELGTRGSAKIRAEESAASSKILKLDARENLAFADGFFTIDHDHILPIVRILRKYRPEIVFVNAPEDRHPDHGRGSKLALEACFYSGLLKIETFDNDKLQQAWRPKQVYHYIQDRFIKPDFVVDVSDFADKKIEAIKAFKSQFYDPNSNEPDSPIAVENFFEYLRGRMAEMGRYILCDYAEGFVNSRPIGLESFDAIR